MTSINNPDIGYQTGQSALNNVVSYLEKQRRENPDKVALMWASAIEPSEGNSPASVKHEKMTVSELSTMVESASAGLKKLGLARGDRVFIFIPMSPQLYVAMFAVQRLGAIAVFLDSWARRDQLSLCAGQTTPRGFIGPEIAFSLIEGIDELAAADIRIVVGEHQGNYSADLGELSASGELCPVCPVSGDDTALVTFTTGSSGPPKGANRRHRFLSAQHQALDRCLPYNDSDVDLPVFPIFSLNNLAGGVTTVLPAVDLARPAATDGHVLLSQMISTGATCCTLSPSLLRAVSAAAQELDVRLDCLLRVTTGGAPIGPDDVAAAQKTAPGADLHILYGSTEVEPIAHLTVSGGEFKSDQEGVCVGKISEGLVYRFLRLHKAPVELSSRGWPEWEVPPGEAGELVVSGEHVCRDYYKNPEAFRSAKIVDTDNLVWHRTGDVCRLDDEGNLWVVGRVHNTICRGGTLLFPVEPEMIMKHLRFVKAAAYVGLPDKELGERALAVFSIVPGTEGIDSAGEVAKALASREILVDEIVMLEDIPLDPRHHSKVEYSRLRHNLMVRNEEDRGDG